MLFLTRTRFLAFLSTSFGLALVVVDDGDTGERVTGVLLTFRLRGHFFQPPALQLVRRRIVVAEMLK